MTVRPTLRKEKQHSVNTISDVFSFCYKTLTSVVGYMTSVSQHVFIQSKQQDSHFMKHIIIEIDVFTENGELSISISPRNL